LGLAAGILTPGSVGCSRLIGTGVVAGCSETDPGARGVGASMAFASIVTGVFAPVEPAGDGGTAFVSTSVALACGCGSTVVATAATVVTACGNSGFWAPVCISLTGVTGGRGERRSAWAVAAASSLGLAAGTEASVVASDAGCGGASAIFVRFSAIASGKPLVPGSLLVPES
jgi:hypothetical protein